MEEGTIGANGAETKKKGKVMEKEKVMEKNRPPCENRNGIEK